MGIISSVLNLVKVIPQKLKFPMNFHETFPECSLPSTVSKKVIKRRGHYSRLRDMMGQSYPIYACTRANQAHYSSVHVRFCGSSKHTLLNEHVGKNLTVRKCRAYRTISYKIWGQITHNLKQRGRKAFVELLFL